MTGIPSNPRSSAVDVSVVVVCFNAAGTLGACLTHLLAQTHPAFEVIVVDDGSTDATVEVAGRAGDERITVLRTHANRGSANARNLGSSRARGRIIAFIDADGFADPDWLNELIAPFDRDATVGAVASTVVFAANPRVLNGAGGRINRRGTGIDLHYGELLAGAELDNDVLYPMGCGMAARRSVAERVGAFDPLLSVYYEDVDFGIRVWRAGYRVVLAPHATVQHDFKPVGRRADKELLCERHRMRVMLKHASPRELPVWVVREMLELRRNEPESRRTWLRAVGWNARHLRGVLAARRRLRRTPRPPAPLFDPAWTDPAAPLAGAPDPSRAGPLIDITAPEADASLAYGWYGRESVGGRGFRWGAARAAVLIRLTAPGRKLQLRYCFAPGVETVTLTVRRPDASVAATIELHPRTSLGEATYPVALAPGDYELEFRSAPGSAETHGRVLGIGLTRLLIDSAPIRLAPQLAPASPDAGDQLNFGWHDAEHDDLRGFRWTSGHAVAAVRLPEAASGLRLVYRLAPEPIGPVDISLRSLTTSGAGWHVRLPRQDQKWRDQSWTVTLPAADYELCITSPRVWAPAGGDQRGIVLALASLSFEPATNGAGPTVAPAGEESQVPG